MADKKRSSSKESKKRPVHKPKLNHQIEAPEIESDRMADNGDHDILDDLLPLPTVIVGICQDYLIPKGKRSCTKSCLELGALCYLNIDDIRESPQWYLHIVCRYGYLDLLRACVDAEWKYEKDSLVLCMNEAVANGHLPVVEFVHQVKASNTVSTTFVSDEDKGTMDLATRTGFSLIVEFLHKNGYSCTTYAMDWAAKNGQLESVKFLHANGYSCAEDARVAMDWAAESGHLETVKFLHENGYSCTTYAMDWAAESGQLETVKFLHLERKEGCTTYAMDWASMNGQLEIVKFLHENGYSCTTHAMDWASMNGQLETVKFLHENGYSCTKGAMDWAARNGHLETVKFLHSERKEGCTTDAMDWAAGKGYLEIVKFLHLERKEGCTTNAMDWAAGNGQLETVKFLHLERNECCTTRPGLTGLPLPGTRNGSVGQ